MLDEFRSTNITWDKATSRIYSPVTTNESDENGRKLVVQIVNGGQVEDLTGATLHLYWETRDKLHDGLDVFKAVDLEKGEFELSYTTGMLSNKGVLNANLVLIDTVGRVVSERFKITVTEGIDNDAIQSENSFSSLTQALIDISDLEQNYAPILNDLTAQLAQTVKNINTLTPNGHTQTLAHRGFSRLAPEGSIPAFLQAYDSGFWGWEADAQRSTDGVWYIFHDTTLDRMTDGTGRLRDKTSTYLDSLTISFGNNIAHHPNLKIPKLRDFLLLSKKFRTPVCVEIKTDNVEGDFTGEDYASFVELIKECGVSDSIIIAGYKNVTQSILERLPSAITMTFDVVETLQTPNGDYLKNNNSIIATNEVYITSRELVDYAHLHGVRIAAFTVNDNIRANKLASWGVDFIISDAISEVYI